jgi:hypothetical protein
MLLRDNDNTTIQTRITLLSLLSAHLIVASSIIDDSDASKRKSLLTAIKPVILKQATHVDHDINGMESLQIQLISASREALFGGWAIFELEAADRIEVGIVTCGHSFIYLNL